MIARKWIDRVVRSVTSTDLPVATRIQRGAFALTMLVVLAIGGTSLGMLYWEIPQQEISVHTASLRLIGTRLESDIENGLDNIEKFSRSSLIWTALTDSSGRDGYLKPFLNGKENDGYQGGLLLTDYKGRVVAGDVRADVPQAKLSHAIETVLSSGEASFLIDTHSGALLAAYPIRFPDNREVIGVLLGSVDLAGRFRQGAFNVAQDHGIRLIADDTRLAQYPAGATQQYYPARYRLFVSGSKSLPSLELEMYSQHDASLEPLLHRSLLYLAIAGLLSLLIWKVAGRMAISLTRRLNLLADACAEATTGGHFVAPDDAATDEIGVLARTLREAIQAHELIRSQLADLVEERTQALNESLERYQQAFEVNTAIKLIIDPEDGRILEANAAACAFYGYPRNELLAMRIWDINVLSQPEIEAEMAIALDENGFYFNFQHRLASGAVRDVEVYSGPIMIAGHRCLHSIVHDVTERKQAEAALRLAEEKYRSVIDSIKEVVFQTDVEGRWTFLNPAWEEITGFTVDESLGQVFLDYVHPDDREHNAALFKPLMTRQTEYCSHEIRYSHHSGGIRWIRVFARLTFDARGEVSGTTGTLMDVTERHEAAERLRLAASVFQHSYEGILLTDDAGQIVDVNAAFSRITGYARDEVLGRNLQLFKSDHQNTEFYARMWTELRDSGYWQGEIWNRRKTGEVYPELLTISAVRDATGSISHYVCVFADISPIKLHEKQLEQIAHYDALTQLPNRVLLAERMRLALAQAKRSGTRVGVCYLDLDGFKAINDTHGHTAGDQFLIDVASRLSRTVRTGDTVARLGGDEFILLLAGIKAAEECEEVLQRLLAAIAEPFFIKGNRIGVSGSIGVAIYPDTHEDADALLRQADQAMYVAKQSGRNRYQIFNPEQDRRLEHRREQIQDLERAVEQNELTLHYQPKANLRTGSVVGVEALLRWQHPALGLLLPGAFLVDLNNAELECRIGQWVLQTALLQIDRWRQQGLNLPVSVNISAPQLEHPDFIPQLRASLAAHPGCNQLLEIEVIESAALGDIDRVAEIIRECRDFGVTFALDDFGTGYSSLTYFRRLPASVLKIDISFIRDMLTDPDDFAIVEGIIGLARAFGRSVVAEGVETEAHAQALLRLGCEVAQGFGIARPMPATDIPCWLAQRQAGAFAPEEGRYERLDG